MLHVRKTVSLQPMRQKRWPVEVHDGDALNLLELNVKTEVQLHLSGTFPFRLPGTLAYSECYS